MKNIMIGKGSFLLIVLIFSVLIITCETPTVPNSDSEITPFSVTSSSFTSGGALAEKYCNNANSHWGTNISPQISWTGAPEDTLSFVLIMDDASVNNWSHWILYYIPPDFTTLPEGLGNNTVDCLEGSIDGGYPPGYKGPYPPLPVGNHNYYFRVYALDISLDYMVASVANRASVLTAMSGHILAEDSIMATHSAH